MMAIKSLLKLSTEDGRKAFDELLDAAMAAYDEMDRDSMTAKALFAAIIHALGWCTGPLSQEEIDYGKKLESAAAALGE